VPPLAWREFEYVEPMAPEGRLEVVTVSGSGAMTSVSGTDFVWDGFDESDIVAVRLVVPLPVGMPEITPVEAERPSPLGSPPEVMDQVEGAVPPLDCREAE
jgi:hypothetical protein